MSSKKSIGKPTIERSASQPKKKKVELDLPEILKGELSKEAEDECRTLEQHMIYILKNRSRVIRETQIAPNIAPTIVPINDLVYRGDPRPNPFNWDFPCNWDGSPKVTC